NCHKPNISYLNDINSWFCGRCELQWLRGAATQDIGFQNYIREMTSVLPYKLSDLHCDMRQLKNQENTYCYCGTPGIYYSDMLRCSKCFQWFHKSCIQPFSWSELEGDHFYMFLCAVCNEGEEVVQRISMELTDLLCLIINTLALKSDRCYFELKTQIIPLVKKYHEYLVDCDEYIKMSEEQLIKHVQKILKSNVRKFANGNFTTGKRKAGESFWALKFQPEKRPPIFGIPIKYCKEDEGTAFTSKTVENVFQAESKVEPFSFY
ncbi:PHD finger protein 19-like protein, partial [Leptotrombidium deliense]